jgi:DNA-3-methyladenine glycosylase
VSGSAEALDVLRGPVLEAAPRLLGSVLSHAGVGVRITEVEAYDGAGDPGSHAYRGRTSRTATMFGPAGRLYVYFTYGMHHCCNVVTGTPGSAAAVLLRAGEVVAGVDLARERRGAATDRDLARGPARLCRCLDLDRSHDGVDLLAAPGPGSTPRLELGPPVEARAVSSGPRVGLRAAADRPWRFWLTGDATVSAYRPATPRPRNRGDRQAP